MLEKDIQKACLDLLTRFGYFCYKINNVGIYKKSSGSYIPAQTKGIADIVCHPGHGRTIYIEVKSEIGRQTESQIEFQKNCERVDIEYWIIRDLDTLIKKIQS